MALKQHSNGNPDGNVLGQSAADKIGFYGKAPLAQQEVPLTPTVAQLTDALVALGLVRRAAA